MPCPWYSGNTPMGAKPTTRMLDPPLSISTGENSTCPTTPPDELSTAANDTGPASSA